MAPRIDKPAPQARRVCLALVACLAALVPACATDGHFTVLGYTTAPNYDTNIRTVRVPVFKNYTFRRGLEFDLTREVCKQIEQKTPYKVVGGNEQADTELLGTITIANKSILSRNQLNEIREAETSLSVELVWRDVQTGEILSRPREGPNAPPVNLQLPSDPAALPRLPGVTLQPPQAETGEPAADGPAPPPGSLPVPGAPLPPKEPPPVVVIQSLSTFIPELGESITTSYQKNVQRMANQIVSMMEAPW